MRADGGLRTLFRQKFPDFMWQSIEVGTVGRGVPDSHYLAPGGLSGWVEFKATETYAAGLRPEQVAWLSRYGRLGGRACVAVRRRHGGGLRRGEPVDELYVFGAADAVRLDREGLLGPTPLLVCRGGVRRWDWDLVRSALLSDVGVGPAAATTGGAATGPAAGDDAGPPAPRPA